MIEPLLGAMFRPRVEKKPGIRSVQGVLQDHPDDLRAKKQLSILQMHKR